MNRLGLRTMLALVLCSPVNGWAQERVCEGFGVADYREFLAMGRAAIGAGKFHKAHRILADTEKEMRCVDHMLHVEDIANLAELITVVSLMDQDEEKARRWTQLRKSIKENDRWGMSIPPAFEQFIRDTPMPSTKVVGDGVVIHPRRQAVTMNGRVLVKLEAPVAVPVFVQIVSKQGVAELSYWQDGTRFRDSLSKGKGKDKVPRWAESLAPEPPEGQGRPMTVADKSQTNSDQEKGWISDADPKEWMPDCKWAGREVKASMASDDRVKINEGIYDISKVSGEVDLRRELEQCHEYRAIKRYDRWRASHKKASAVGAVSGTDLKSIGRAFKQATHEVAADMHRASFLKALNVRR